MGNQENVFLISFSARLGLVVAVLPHRCAPRQRRTRQVKPKKPPFYRLDRLEDYLQPQYAWMS